MNNATRTNLQALRYALTDAREACYRLLAEALKSGDMDAALSWRTQAEDYASKVDDVVAQYDALAEADTQAAA